MKWIVIALVITAIDAGFLPLAASAQSGASEVETTQGETGACCYYDIGCEILTQAKCEGTAGFWRGAGTTCDYETCTGACCFYGSCTIIDPYTCGRKGGAWHGFGSPCSPDPCVGACCYADGRCDLQWEPDCRDYFGEFQGYGTTCDPNPCAPLPPTDCSRFDDGTVQSWTAQAATIALDGPSLDGTMYLRCGDEPSPPTSAIMAPAPYHGDLTSAGGVCLDFILHQDGDPGSVPVSRVFVMGDLPSPGAGNQAMFILNTAIVEGDGWHQLTMPLVTVPFGSPPPSGADGYWTMSPPTADWNALLANVQTIWFPGDIAGSPSELEDFGFDNFCLSACDDVTAVESSSWGRVKTFYRR